MCKSFFGGGGGGGDGGAAEARAREDARQARIQQGMTQINDTFSKFDDAFFDTRRAAYQEYALPQLEDQWRKAQDALTFSLSRGGNLNSSVAGERLGDAKTEYTRNRQAIIDQALQYANQARSDVERGRSDVTSQLSATADPTAASQAAAARAATLNAMPAFQPLGNLFQNVTAAAAASQAGTGGVFGRNQTGVGLFSGAGGRGGGRVVN